MADNTKGFYIGAGVSSIKDYQDGVEDITRIRATELLGGYKYNDALGIELRVGNGYQTGTSSFYFSAPGTAIQSGALERTINNYKSIYYKPELINDEAKFYALLGYTSVNSSVDVQDNLGNLVSQTEGSNSGYSYGLGVGFVVSAHFNFNIEYKNICDEISGKPNMASVNMDYRF